MFYTLPCQASVVSALIGSYLVFIIGTSLTWSSPVIPKLKDPNETPFDVVPTVEDTTWISSLTLLGASLGSIIFPFLADHLGRRLTIIILGVPAVFCYLAMGFWQVIEIYYAARIILGVVLGGTMSVVPVYIAELANKSNRAALGTFVSCGISGGCLFSYALGPFVKVNVFNIVLATFPSTFLVLFVLFGEETAHFYILRGRESEARIALSKLRGRDEDINSELADMKVKLQSQKEGSLVEMLKTKFVLKAFVIAIGLLIFQQFSGINIFLFYSQTVFEMSGSNLDARFCPIIVGSVQFVSSLISILSTDKIGRKPLLIASAIGMIVSLVPLGVYCCLRDLGYNLDVISFIPILTLAFALFMYNNGLGPLPWAILAEIFPSRIKALGTSVATLVNWTLAFILTKYFESLKDALGLGESFLFYAVCCGICVIFVKFFVIETKGKTLEDIQDDLS